VVSCTDEDAAGDPAAIRFYLVRGLDVSGAPDVALSVPAGAGGRAVRELLCPVRLSPIDGNGQCTPGTKPTGWLTGGEVEDPNWVFNPTAVTLSDLRATTLSTGERLWALLRDWLQR
jgi:hypothetical protein